MSKSNRHEVIGIVRPGLSYNVAARTLNGTREVNSNETHELSRNGTHERNSTATHERYSDRTHELRGDTCHSTRPSAVLDEPRRWPFQASSMRSQQEIR
jgi:hypothetical protein